MRFIQTGFEAIDFAATTGLDGRRAWALAEEWWNPNGPYKTLHKYTSLRLRFLRDRLARHFGCDPGRRLPLNGVRVVDIGCGGGLLSEQLAFMGADVVGIDVVPANVDAARMHAVINAVDIDYRLIHPGRLSEEGERFDGVIDTAVFARTADLKAAVETNCRLVKPGGIVVTAARDWTFKSRMLAAMGVAQISTILPAADRASIQFTTREGLRQEFARYGVSVDNTVGISYNPWLASFRLSTGGSSGYFAVATRPRKPTLTVVG